MRRIPAVVTLLALVGGLVAMTGSPASAGQSEAAEASDLIEVASTLVIDLVSVAFDANLTVAGTGVVDASITVGP
jgi:hypothetical protein